MACKAGRSPPHVGWMLTGVAAPQAVLVHQLSRRASQNPFRKNRGRVVRVAFHPVKPFFFVATQNNVRIYNLAKQALAKKLIGGSGTTSMAVHPSGDHIILGNAVSLVCLTGRPIVPQAGCTPVGPGVMLSQRCI